MRAPEAVSIRCHRCGGTFGFLPYPGNARCPYCGFEGPVSAELLAELQRYAGSVERELARADHAYLRAATWQQWSETAERGGPRLKVVVPLASGLTLLAAAAVPIGQALEVPREILQSVVPVLAIVPCAFLMGYVLWSYSGKGSAAKRAVAGNIVVACPNCGARSELVAGAAAQACGYCRAALVASAPVMQRGIDAAEVAHRRARLEEFRQERLGMVAIARSDMTAFVPYFVGGSLLLPLGGMTVAFTAATLTGDEPYAPALPGAWALTLALVAFLLFVPLRRSSCRRAYAQALADLGRQFPVQPLTDMGSVASWLNRYWPAKYDVAHLTRGVDFVAATFDALGYPALLNANLTATSPRRPRLHLLLAAHRRTDHVVQGEAAQRYQQALARCRSLGFQVTANEAGLLAEADHETRRIIGKNPAALHELAPVLAALADAARATGAVPAQPIG